ncbi:MAG: MBL fold metallo-hydrolase [Planctomycetota bacterium]|nr:MAG: MBL fold metallo-hydrolase [Planctomycetota bacterium]
MATSYRIISIGTLSRNRLWNETAAQRTAFSTTTLIRHDTTNILVDPGLPAQILSYYLDERAGIRPADIDVVFLTTFRPVHRRSLSLFDQADWLMHGPEIEAMYRNLDEIEERDQEGSEAEDIKKLVQDERSLLEHIQPADDKLASTVHLYPTPGITPGSAGLLLAFASRTVIIAGDAVVTQDYFESGRIFEQIFDVDQARESFAEIIEIADEIIPGHDNLFSTPGC